MTSSRELQNRVLHLLKEDVEASTMIKGLQTLFGPDQDDLFIDTKAGRFEAKFGRVQKHSPTKDGFDALGINLLIVGTMKDGGVTTKTQIAIADFNMANTSKFMKHKFGPITSTISTFEEFQGELFANLIGATHDAKAIMKSNPYLDNFQKGCLSIFQNRLAGINLAESYGLIKPDKLVQTLLEA